MAESLADYFDPAFEMESPLASIRGESYRGYAGIEQWVRDLDEQFAEWSITLHDLREIGDQVLAIGTVDARGRASGVTIRFPTAGVCDFGADDRVTHMRIYSDVKEALEAVGFGELTVSAASAVRIAPTLSRRRPLSMPSTDAILRPSHEMGRLRGDYEWRSFMTAGVEALARVRLTEESDATR